MQRLPLIETVANGARFIESVVSGEMGSWPSRQRHVYGDVSGHATDIYAQIEAWGGSQAPPPGGGGGGSSTGGRPPIDHF